LSNVHKFTFGSQYLEACSMHTALFYLGLGGGWTPADMHKWQQVHNQDMVGHLRYSNIHYL